MEKENNKTNKNSRRDFIIGSSAIAVGLVSYSLFKPFKLFAKGPAAAGDSIPVADSNQPIIMSNAKKTKIGSHIWYGWAFDIDKCIGCGSCAQACKKENDVPTEPFFFRSWVEQYIIKEDETIMCESINGGIDGFKQIPAEENVYKAFFVPKSCNHCAKSPCEQVCPVGATFLSPEGVVLIDQEYCIGCGYCVQACPYGCRYIHPKRGVADKCTFCYHRLKKGMAPACIEVCPTGARIYGNLHDKDSELSKFIKDKNCVVLKAQLNTGSKLYYNALSQEVR